MKMKSLEHLFALFLFAISFNVNAFQNGDVISFDPGVRECVIPGNIYCGNGLPYIVSKGSYFALDLNGTGSFSPDERIPLTPGPDGGIILGSVQPGPGIDQPWLFLNTQGMHQTSIPVTQNADGSLDFSGWGAYWNGLAIPLGDTGKAMVSCSHPLPCSVGDAYQVDYVTTVTSGPFTGVRYQLHLENVDKIPSLKVSMQVNGGTTQECASIGGNTVTATASVSLLNGAELASIQWQVDGQPVGGSENLSTFVQLGSHQLSVTATAVGGQQDTASATITIKDTQAPIISAAFIDSRSGAEINSIDTKNTSFVDVSMSATDVCDAAPVTSGIGGFELSDGSHLKIQGNLDKVELTTSSLRMQADADDASGNQSVVYKTLTITP